MKKTSNVWFAVVILAVATLACGATSTLTPTLDVNEAAATLVAATLAALTQNAPQQPSDTPNLLRALPPEASPTFAPTMPPLPPALRVAYVKDNNAWIWTEGLGTLALTASGDVQDVRISGDGLVVAYVRQSAPFSPEIWAVDNDGSNTRLLVSSADFWATYTGSPSDAPSGIGPYQFGWRPGTHILYYNAEPLFEGPGLMGYDDLHTVNADTLAKVTIFSSGDGGKFYFSTDGAQMAIVTPTSISLANADGSNLRPDVLTFASVITYSEYLYYPSPVWAADSNVLRVTIPPADPMLTPLNPTGVWYIPTDGSPAVLSTNILAIPFAWPDTAISPDLARIAYAQSIGLPADNMRELHLANADGSADTVYMMGESLELINWLPNSTQFVFVVRGSGATRGIHVGTVGGGYITLSADPTKMRDIAWVDDTHFLYLWSNSGTWELRYNILSGVGSTLLDKGQIWGYDFSK